MISLYSMHLSVIQVKFRHRYRAGIQQKMDSLNLVLAIIIPELGQVSLLIPAEWNGGLEFTITFKQKDYD